MFITFLLLLTIFHICLVNSIPLKDFKPTTSLIILFILDCFTFFEYQIYLDWHASYGLKLSSILFITHCSFFYQFYLCTDVHSAHFLKLHTLNNLILTFWSFSLIGLKYTLFSVIITLISFLLIYLKVSKYSSVKFKKAFIFSFLFLLYRFKLYFFYGFNGNTFLCLFSIYILYNLKRFKNIFF